MQAGTDGAPVWLETIRAAAAIQAMLRLSFTYSRSLMGVL